MKRNSNQVVLRMVFSLITLAILQITNAQIVYTDVNPGITSSGTYNLDLNNDGTIDFVIQHTSSTVTGKGNCKGQTGTNQYIKVTPLNNNQVLDTGANPKRMLANIIINNTQSSWSSQANQVIISYEPKCTYWCYWDQCGYSMLPLVNGQWYPSMEDGYLGLRLNYGGHSYFGWVRINISEGGVSFTIKEYAFNSNADQAIIAGQSSTEYLGISTVENPLCAGKSVIIPYIIAGAFSSSNVVTAELSDATGSFASPVAIGNVTSNVSGNISAVIPVLTPSGTSYRIRVRSSNPARTSNPNSYNLTMNGGVLPSGTIAVGEPYSTNICYGYVSLVSWADQEACNSYQWKLNGNDISGATSRTYNPIAAGDYTCIITNGAGTVTSNIITVNSSPGPDTIYSDFYDTPTVACGASVNLYAGTSGSFTYQWKRNAIDIPGATSYNYTATTTGDYSCVFTNVCGSRISNTITVYPDMIAPVITAAGSTTVCNPPVTLNANTSTGLSYEWYYNNEGYNNIYPLIPGATSSSYAASVTGYYYVKETNVNGCTRNSNIIFTLIGAPVATINASSGTICQGNPVSLYANIPYSGSFSYQWIKDGVDIGGAKDRAYIAKKAGVYSVRVSISSGDCSSTSAGVIITNGCNTGTTAARSSNNIESVSPGLNDIRLQIYPNPVSSSATISFSLSDVSKVSLTLFDINGRLVKRLADKQFNNGYHQITLDTKELNAGIYLLRMQSSEFIETRKIIVMK